MKTLTSSIAVCVLVLTTGECLADIELPAMFSDHMVVQRDKPIRIWGSADSGQTVSVALGDRSAQAEVDGDGHWELTLGGFPAGGPYELTVKAGDQSVTIDDVLVGEVWLCSGQSNMAMTVNRVRDAEQETAAAQFPRIRMFKVTSGHALEPQEACQGDWSVCSPESVPGFSATAYFFGRRLHGELDVPIGLINSSVGGTSVESWTSMPAQSAVAAIKPRLDAWREADDAFDPDKAKVQYETALARWEKRRDAAKKAGQRTPRKPRLASRPRNDRNYPANLFNGKINPLVGYTIRGAIWYQGENSSGRGFAHLYGHQLRTLIRDWRARWDQGDFPFAWVQLPNFRAPQTKPSETSGWVLVQEGMLNTLSEPNTGMAITIDVGEANDIHPRDKQSVGNRLAAWALGAVYQRDVVTSGPVYRSAKRAGNRMIVEFDHIGEGLSAKGDDLTGFAIAGDDRVFHWADATIDGSRVVVSSDKVAAPAAVRYAWAANPQASLYNSAGLPASPFRTDDWDESGSQ